MDAGTLKNQLRKIVRDLRAADRKCAELEAENSRCVCVCARACACVRA